VVHCAARRDYRGVGGRVATGSSEDRELTVGLQLIGQAGKRGLVPRVPATERLVADVEAFLRADVGDALGAVVRAEPEADAATLRATFHPAAEPVEFHVAPGGRVEVAATTAHAGPGYHTWLCHLLRRMATELSLEWADADAEVPSRDGAESRSRDDTGYFWSDDRGDVERAHLVWLRAVLRRAADPPLGRTEPIPLASFAGHRFAADGAIISALGPRPDAWLADALDRPSLAADVWPWMTDAQDARYMLNRARCLMWTDVRWRAPATDEERATLDEVIRLLRRAFPLEPSLPYPWREWRETLQLAGLATDPMTERIVREAEAAEASDSSPLIGYRRRPVQVDHAGWTLTVPGSWAERRTDEEWWGGEAGRSITLAGVQTGEAGEPMPAKAFLDRVAGHLGREPLTHVDGPLLGRARIEIDASSGIEVATLDGYVAVLGRGAAIRVQIHDPSDWEWALDMWRSLSPAP
jgi:hypothetical protein